MHVMTGPADLYRYRANVLYWHDGDTFQADVDLGCHVHWHGYVRCAGYDSPEVYGTTKAAGVAATLYVVALAPAGSTVYLNSTAFPRSQQDSFGRMLAHITLADGTDLATAMIGSGNATAI